MKKLTYLIFLVFTISSCSYDSERRCYACTKEQNKAVADFLKSSIKDSNNMSDEEMEDVISELRETGIKLFCDQKMVKYNKNTGVVYDADTSRTYHLYIY